MPDPKKFKEKQEFMDSCMHQVKTVEGEPQDKAVSKCLGLWGSKNKKKKCASELIREQAGKLLEV
jgi:hypothetical protein